MVERNESAVHAVGGIVGTGIAAVTGCRPSAIGDTMLVIVSE